MSLKTHQRRKNTGGVTRTGRSEVLPNQLGLYRISTHQYAFGLSEAEKLSVGSLSKIFEKQSFIDKFVLSCRVHTYTQIGHVTLTGQDEEED